MSEASESDWRANLAAWERATATLGALAAMLTPREWQLPTDCPGWSVGDHVAHVAAVERWLLDAGGTPEGRRYVDDTETDVAARRGRSPQVVVAELREVVARRGRQLRSGEIDLAQEVTAPFGPRMPYGELLMYRAFDCFVHEQDMRRALRRPGNLDAPGAGCTRTVIESSLPYVVAKRAAASPGQAVRFEVDGPLAFTAQVVVGPDGRGRRATGDVTPTVTLSMDWETFVRLGCGRCRPDEVAVRISGDVDLATRVLAGMSVTP